MYVCNGGVVIWDNNYNNNNSSSGSSSSSSSSVYVCVYVCAFVCVCVCVCVCRETTTTVKCLDAQNLNIVHHESAGGKKSPTRENGKERKEGRAYERQERGYRKGRRNEGNTMKK